MVPTELPRYVDVLPTPSLYCHFLSEMEILDGDGMSNGDGTWGDVEEKEEKRKKERWTDRCTRLRKVGWAGYRRVGNPVAHTLPGTHTPWNTQSPLT